MELSMTCPNCGDEITPDNEVEGSDYCGDCQSVFEKDSEPFINWHELD